MLLKDLHERTRMQLVVLQHALGVVEVGVRVVALAQPFHRQGEDRRVQAAPPRRRGAAHRRIPVLDAEPDRVSTGIPRSRCTARAAHVARQCTPGARGRPPPAGAAAEPAGERLPAAEPALRGAAEPGAVHPELKLEDAGGRRVQQHPVVGRAGQLAGARSQPPERRPRHPQHVVAGGVCAYADGAVIQAQDAPGAGRARGRAEERPGDAQLVDGPVAGAARPRQRRASRRGWPARPCC